MARKPRGAAAEKELELELLKALRFVSLAQQENGQAPYQSHCRFINNYVVAFDGILAAGYPVEQPLYACPHTFKLIAALTRVRGAYSVTMTSDATMVINSDRFRAVVDCLPSREISEIAAHPNTYPLTSRWIEACEKAGLFITEGATTVLESSVFTQQYTVIGCNRLVMIEAATDNNFPPGLVVPYTAIKALAKVQSPLVGFGYDQTAVTFWFENGAWLRTQLFVEQYPNMASVQARLDAMTCVELPSELEKGVAAVLPFCKEGKGVLYVKGKLSTHRDEDGANVGASYVVGGPPVDVSFNAAQFIKIAPLIKTIDFTSQDDMIMFLGDKVRGAFTQYR